MGENENKLDSDQLYFIEPDESASLLGHVTNASVECSTENNDISVLSARLAGLEASFEMVAIMSQDLLLAITGMREVIINSCPDRRVAHLAVHGKTARIRKKNFNRSFRILEEN